MRSTERNIQKNGIRIYISWGETSKCRTLNTNLFRLKSRLLAVLVVCNDCACEAIWLLSRWSGLWRRRRRKWRQTIPIQFNAKKRNEMVFCVTNLRFLFPFVVCCFFRIVKLTFPLWCQGKSTTTSGNLLTIGIKYFRTWNMRSFIRLDRMIFTHLLQCRHIFVINHSELGDRMITIATA